MEISNGDINIWEALCNKDPGCTPFQTPFWMDICRLYLGAEMKIFLIRQNSETAFWPMLVKKTALGPVLFRPFGSYGGLISEAPLSENFKENLKKKFNNKTINEVIHPFTRNKFTLGEAQSYETYFIDIKNLAADNITSHWKKGHKYNFKFAQKQELQIVEGSSSKNISNYFNIYEKTFKRWEKPRGSMYSKKLFQLLDQSPYKQKFVKIWECHYKNQLISGTVIFYFQQKAYAWHAATDPDFYHFYPGQLLQYHIIKHALENEISIYDLCPNPGLKGVADYKLGFGAKEHEVIHFVNSSPLRKALSPLKALLKK